MEKIKQINENEIKVDGCVYRKVEEPKPDLIDGRWYIAIIDNVSERYLIKYKDDNGNISCYMYIVFMGDVTNSSGWFDYIEREATHSEIESHLKKICDEKYIGKNVAGSFLGQYDGFARIFDFYDIVSDSVYYKNYGHGVCVYKQGKWAEIIPDKKKLPKTKEEFIKFLAEYDNVWWGKSKTNFLNDYE